MLIFDEVFTGFRLAYRGAQEYFGIQADMVTYGKTLGGGLPVGVLCGRRDLMKCYRDVAPADVSLARGTFNSHPYVMGAMHEFLGRLESPDLQRCYENLDATWNARVEKLNARLKAADLPVRVANMQTVLTVLYDVPSRYNWMFQFYLRAEGLELSWIGSGRFIMSLDYTALTMPSRVTRPRERPTSGTSSRTPTRTPPSYSPPAASVEKKGSLSCRRSSRVRGDPYPTCGS